MSVGTRPSLNAANGPLLEWLSVQWQPVSETAARGRTHAWGDMGDGVRFH